MNIDDRSVCDMFFCTFLFVIDKKCNCNGLKMELKVVLYSCKCFLGLFCYVFFQNQLFISGRHAKLFSF